jgi:hypothetical protein
MGAHWYLFSTTGLNIEAPKDQFLNSPDNLLPKSFAQQFQLLEQQEFVKESPPLPSGKRLKWPKFRLQYGLHDTHLNLLKPFFIDIFQIIKNVAKPGSYNYFDEMIDPFVEQQFSQIEITQQSLDRIDDQLATLPENYFLRYWKIPQTVVYHGWPTELSTNSLLIDISGFTLFSSHEKMDVIPEDTILLHKLRDHIVNQLRNKYAMTEHLYVMGF